MTKLVHLTARPIVAGLSTEPIRATRLQIEAALAGWRGFYPHATEIIDEIELASRTMGEGSEADPASAARVALLLRQIGLYPATEAVS